MTEAFSRRFRRSATTLSFAWLAAAALSAGARGGVAPVDDPRTILDRVYSVGQADRGEQTFKRSCTGCHAATDFAGGVLASRWEGGSLDDIFEVIAKSMPANDPGSLKPEESASVIAFFLHMDGYPVGDDDLPGDADVLKKIAIVPNPK
jgi:mono/diheme cytochrome c family protein